jgi:3-oxocholest-4-en-26-oyl-CoA dehydrogenase beta subunit
MDFTLSEEQEAVRQVAGTILGDLATPERVKEVERSADRVDWHLWSALAAAGLLGIAVPEADGGAGLGVTELCLVLEQQGRRVAPVPLVWAAVAAMAVSRFGTPREREAWARRVVGGDVVVTCALAGTGVEARRGPGGAWLLTGDAVSVPYAHVAGRVLVPARTGGGTVVALVDPGAAQGEVAEATDHQLLTHLRFDRAPADAVLGGPEVLEWALQRALVGVAAVQLGVAEEALALAAAYTSNRFQFGRPLSSFQSTSARAADAYIDTEAMRVTVLQAAWRLDHGRDASTAVAVAKWWAAEAGQRVVHTTQHLHGGLGADVEYPVHRYFLVGKQLSETLGGAGPHLAQIGAALAAGT